MNLEDKKVLLVGLGILGGGEALAKFLINQKTRLTITDLRNRKILAPVIKRLGKGKAKLVLGRHRPMDFKENEIIIFNPAVSIFSSWVRLARKYNKIIENDLTLFLKLLEAKKSKTEYIGITGTRGKTTTALWINHFLPNSALAGNIPQKGLLSAIERNALPLVLELSSFQLEFLQRGTQAPKIAVITNLYNDHLNRYGDLKKYIQQKAKIFLNQAKEDSLILNADDKYTKEFLRKRPRSKIYYVSLKKLPAGKCGLYFIGDKIYFKKNSKVETICSVKNLANHQKYNLLVALLSAHLYGRPWAELIGKIQSLPQAPYRQEIVLENSNGRIINDSAATSPDGTIAALERFGARQARHNGLILIAGGTDKKLDFSELANKIKSFIQPRNLFLLQGSATSKLVKDLDRQDYFNKDEVPIFNSLMVILEQIAGKKIKHQDILFSPGAASFEKFKNEFDRGRQFNRIVDKIFKQ